MTKIGTTTKMLGIKGYKKLEIGTPVYDIGEKYMVLFELLDSKEIIEVCYYKKTLQPFIDFDKK